MGPASPHAYGHFWEKNMPEHTRRHFAVSCAEIAERIEMPFGLCSGWTQGSMCYMAVHIGATGRIRLNRPCSGGPNEAVAMRPYVKLLWPVIIFRPHRSTTYVLADRVAWSVCRSVFHSSECCKKRLNRWRCRLGWGFRLAQETMCYMWVQIPVGMGNFKGGGEAARYKV